MTGTWEFPEIAAMAVQGRDLAEDNFAREDRSNAAILVREALQNPLDARSGAGPVRVSLRLLEPGDFDSSFLATLITPDFVARLSAAAAEKADLNPTAASVLVIEDFGTTGLRGTYDDSNADGDTENWNAFWFREGEGAKAGIGSNGRAGQGKVTYYRASDARAIFGLTTRSSDGRTLLMGRASFRRVYRHTDGSKYERHSFWCKKHSESARPVEDQSVRAEFAKAFCLGRNAESGLSLIIPFPHDFTIETALKTVVTDFYFPIARGRLVVTVQGSEINAGNIDQIADEILPDQEIRELGSSFTHGFRKFARTVTDSEKAGEIPVVCTESANNTQSLLDSAFPEGAAGKLKQDLAAGNRVSIRFPVTVRPKRHPVRQSFFDVHVQIADDLTNTEEAIIRRDLVIGAERHLGGASYLQKARGLLVVEDDALSALLADAEEPTHLKWNASRPRLAEDYRSAKEVIRYVRSALPRVLAFLSEAAAVKDTKALARYFAKPGGSKLPQPAGQQNSKAGAQTKTGTKELPKPARKPFRLHMLGNEVRVLPNGSAGPTLGELPFQDCSLECAYEELEGDPFGNYDPLDFDLADASAFVVTATGVQIVTRAENRIVFEVVDPNFELVVRGFDQNLRLRARMTYGLTSFPESEHPDEEAANGAAVGN